MGEAAVCRVSAWSQRRAEGCYREGVSRHYAAKLAERGFIVFAPHNPYRGEDQYRFLSRKANCVKRSLFSFILARHE